ncbi:MAG: hypothetical protein Q9209_000044 [Squamulea sp. 1 TL-2023]
MIPCPNDSLETHARNLIEHESSRIETEIMGNDKVAGNFNGLQLLRETDRQHSRIERLERNNKLLKNEKVDKAYVNKLEQRLTSLETDLGNIRLELSTLKAIGESLFDIRRRELHKLFKFHPDITAQFDNRLIQQGSTSAHEGNALADAALFQHDRRDDRSVYMKLYGLSVEEVLATGKIFPPKTSSNHTQTSFANVTAHTASVSSEDTRHLLSELSSYATIFFKRESPSPELQKTFRRFIEEVRSHDYKVPVLEPHTSDLGLALSAYRHARNTFRTEKGLV